MKNEAESKRLGVAMGLFGVLGVLSLTTLSGAIRMVTLIVLGGLAVKTWIAHLRRKQEEGSADGDNQKD
jgi:hypothetical protein